MHFCAEVARDRLRRNRQRRGEEQRRKNARANGKCLAGHAGLPSQRFDRTLDGANETSAINYGWVFYPF
jgi:hypothetical protein